VATCTISEMIMACRSSKLPASGHSIAMLWKDKIPNKILHRQTELARGGLP
jgi:hypothetical protein